MPARARPDACPGAWALHEAADGLLARVRIPGGLLTAAQLAGLADLAAVHGDGRLELTSRGNLQLRGLADDAIAGPLAEAGLLPSATHERVRNIVASPLSGLDGSPDITGVVRELDRALCARPGLAALPGRFLFAVDDGRGDVAALDADITLLPGAAIADALDLAEQFLTVRTAEGSTAWRVADLAGGLPGPVGAGLITGGGPSSGRPPSAHGRPPVGVIGRALVVLAPLGRLGAEQARWLASTATAAGLRITPWRSIVLAGLADPHAAAAAAAGLGLGVDDTSPWYYVSACTGRPGCARALADVQSDARAAVGRWPGKVVRWSGCARRCGRPADTEIDVIATEDGYAVV